MEGYGLYRVYVLNPLQQTEHTLRDDSSPDQESITLPCLSICLSEALSVSVCRPLPCLCLPVNPPFCPLSKTAAFMKIHSEVSLSLRHNRRISITILASDGGKKKKNPLRQQKFKGYCSMRWGNKMHAPPIRFFLCFIAPTRTVASLTYKQLSKKKKDLNLDSSEAEPS